jgi:hypothetical protein
MKCIELQRFKESLRVDSVAVVPSMESQKLPSHSAISNRSDASFEVQVFRSFKIL